MTITLAPRPRMNVGLAPRPRANVGIEVHGSLYNSPRAAPLFARMTNQPSDAVKTAIDTLLSDLDAIIDKLDCLYIVGNDQQQSLLNWVQDAYNGATHGTVNFTPYRGFKGNGTNFFINTFFVPNGSTKYQRNSCAVGAIMQDTAGTGTLDRTMFGVYGATAGTGFVGLNPQQNNNGFNGQKGSLGVPAVQVFSAPIYPSHWDMSRNGSAGYTRYRDGAVSQVYSSFVDSGPVYDSHALTLLAWNAGGDVNNPVPIEFGSHTQSMFYIGGGLTDQEVADIYFATNKYMAAVGAETLAIRDPVGAFEVQLNYSGLEGGAVSLDGNGNIVPGTPGTTYPTASNADFAYYKSLGINHLRLPIKWERIQQTLNGPLDPTYKAVIDAAVGFAVNNALTLTLDVHNYGGYLGNKIGDGTLTKEHFADLWGKLASAYKGTAVTAYDLMNEPSNMPSTQAWKDAAQAAISAIRLADTSTPIIVEGNGYSSAYQWIANGNDILKSLYDPSGNLIFSAHTYCDRDNSGTHYAWLQEVAAGDQLDGGATLDTNIAVKRISVFSDWCKVNGLKGNIGELGVGNDNQGWLDALDKALAYCQTNKRSVTYWNTGPYYDGYPYSIGRGSLPTHVQVSVLTKYTNAPQPLNYVLSGPITGTTGSPSTVFTIDCRGYITSPVTFFPSDGGAGGTFNHTSLTIPPGFNGQITFTYTAPADAVYAISVTNDSGLTNAPALGYATVTDLFQNAGAPVQNILWFSKLKANYIGPCLQLRRASDNAVQDFGFTSIQLYAPLDTAAISAWAGGSNVYVVKWYDQSGKSNLAGPVRSIDGYAENGQAAPTLADQPQLILSGRNGKPVVRWNANRMDLAAPIDGLTGLTILSAFNPDSAAGSRKLGWALVQNYGFDSNFYMTDQIGLPLNTTAGEWHSYFARFQAATANGIQTFKDGAVAFETNSAGIDSHITFQYRSVANLGYFKFAPVAWGGYDAGLIIFSGAVTDAALAAFHSRMMTEYAVPATGTSNHAPAYAATPTLGPTDTVPLPHCGINISGLDFGTMLYPDSFDAGYYASLGLNTIRLPFILERLQPVLNGPLDTTVLANITNVVNSFTSQSMQVILDMHDYGKLNRNTSTNFVGVLTVGSPIIALSDTTGIYPGYTLTGNGIPSGAVVNSVDSVSQITMNMVATAAGGSSITCASNYAAINSAGGVSNAEFAYSWSLIADAFKNNPRVALDLQNEPAWLNAADMAVTSQAAITAIRNTGFSGWIHVESGGSFSQAAVFVASGAGAAALTVSDPLNKLVFHLHQYLDSDYSGRAATAIPGRGAIVLQDCTNFARAHGLKLFLGEFGVSTDLGNMKENTDMLLFMKNNQDVWVGWTAWGGGQYWAGDYPFRMDCPSRTAPYPITLPTQIIVRNKMN